MQKSFVEIEEEILEFWKTQKSFEKSNVLSKDRKKFTFYDGPPFATGLPHYGHILSGTIKDVMTRYKYQHGFHVERRFGWDCHGLPVEYEIDKKLGIKNRKQVEDMGIKKYNEECRSIVMTYSNQWEETVERMGRWVDFKNSYKTMDISFMESVWYIFAQLFKKNYVYRGYKVMPFSTGCMTSLSNFESNLNYKMVSDPSIVVAFPLKKDFMSKKVSVLAWTTTPWTLPSNCGLVINKKFEYVLAQIKDIYCIMLESRIDSYFKKYKVIDKIKGEQLIGLEYEQPFNYFEKFRKNGFFRILDDNFVSADNGTGIVHCAPGFGEEDYNCFVRKQLIERNELVPCPVNENGCFTEEVQDFKGIYIKDADKLILKKLKDKVFFSSQIHHSYPFCWRSEKPLIYKLVPNWFIKVSTSITDLLKNNDSIKWIPNEVKEKRFHNWLKNAKDWAISRNRFWGTSIPLWVSDDLSEIVCVQSVEELEKLSRQKITDLHRENIDEIVFERNGKLMRRIPDVFDCWFESGSMPYAQNHWPFCLSGTDKLDKNDNSKYVMYKENVFDNFSADFIGEGLDQTRGWFYTLHVISTLLFNKPAFKNVIVNGIVLAQDGKKMSKKEKNYPDPHIIFNKYGADSLRFYLISSPVVEAQDLKFSERGVQEITKTVLIPWSNIMKFYKDSAETTNKFGELDLDVWIKNRFNEFLQKVSCTMENYEMSKVLSYSLKFIDELSNWYLRIYRTEIRNGHTAILKQILINFSVIMAPFVPFYSEYTYKVLTEKESVHFEMYPEKMDSSSDNFENAREVIEAIRNMRENNQISLKTPVKKVTVFCDPLFSNIISKYIPIIVRECNILCIEFKKENEADDISINLSVKPKFEILKKDLKSINIKSKLIRKLTAEDIEKLTISDLDIENIKIKQEDVIIDKQAESTKGLCSGFDKFILVIDNEVDNEVLEKKISREFNSFIQKTRKSLNLKIDDTVYIEVECDSLIKMCLKNFDIMFGTEGKVVGSATFPFDGKDLEVILRKVN